jgi:hypothetical protein
MFKLNKGVVKKVGTDTPVAYSLKYVKPGSVTSVVNTTATNLVLTSTAGVETYAYATYDTFGKLVDAINAAGNFVAKLLDARRDDATASTTVTGTIAAVTFEDSTTYDVFVDTSVALSLSYRVCPSRVPGSTENLRSRRIHAKLLKYGVNMGTAAVDSVQMFECDPISKTETKIDSWLSVDTTETTVFDWSTGDLAYTLKPGNELLVRVKDAAALGDATTNYVQVGAILEQSGLEA